LKNESRSQNPEPRILQWKYCPKAMPSSIIFRILSPGF
jgi:hypothetical protein